MAIELITIGDVYYTTTLGHCVAIPISVSCAHCSGKLHTVRTRPTEHADNYNTSLQK